MRQMMLAIQMYQQDNDNYFPTTEQVWSAVNFPPGSLACPTFSKDRPGYGYVRWLSGNMLGQPGMPPAAKCVVMADCKETDRLIAYPSQADYRHTGKAIIGYADGHVALQKETEVYIPAIGKYELIEQWCSPWWGQSTATFRKTLNTAYTVDVKVPDSYGWESNVFDDPINKLYGSIYAAGSGQKVVIQGFGYPISAAAPLSVAEPYLRWPVPADAQSIGAGGQWLLSLPKFVMPLVGAFFDIISPTDDPGAITGKVEIAVLDAEQDDIVRFRFELDGSNATYNVIGNTAVTLATVADPDNIQIFSNSFGISGFKLHYGYKYGVTGSNYGWPTDIPQHGLTIIGEGNGNIVVNLSTTGVASEQINGITTVQPAAGGNVRNPCWVEFRVTSMHSDNGGIGLGSLHIANLDNGGGCYWNAE
jgi:prepilin-type processing-associated H-X9-DG protein